MREVVSAATIDADSALTAALVRAQAKMPAVEKDAINPHFRSKFTSLDHLIARTRPVLNEEGLAIVQFPAVSDIGQPVLRTVIVHEQGGQMSADAPLFLPKQDMQALGSAISYARRYAWASACGIASETDDDGEQAVKAKPEPTQAAAPPPGEKKEQPVNMSDARQKAQIHALIDEIKLPDEQYRQALEATYGVTSSADLTQDQARDLVERLREAKKLAGVTT